MNTTTNDTQQPVSATRPDCAPPIGSAPILEYQPELWTVKKDDIYAALNALEAGLEHARENLTRHDKELGRKTRKNEMWANQLERDIEGMERIIGRLRKYSADTMPC